MSVRRNKGSGEDDAGNNVVFLDPRVAESVGIRNLCLLDEEGPGLVQVVRGGQPGLVAVGATFRRRLMS